MSSPRPPERSRPVAAKPIPTWLDLLAIGVAAACLIVATSFQLFDTDVWQHLVRAKAILALKTIPVRQMWTWPMFGAPEKDSAWAFALLVWPFWSLGGVLGLFVWRWLTTLLAFGIAWATARRLGARGVSTLVVMVACAMVYRQRSQVRPEALAAGLLALTIWVLETRRRGGRDHALWLIPIAWLWPAVHASFHLGWLAIAAFAVDEGWRGGRRPRRDRPSAAEAARAPARRVPLLFVLSAAIAISFLNPLGASALSGPLDYLLRLRHEPLYGAIGELKPIDWSIHRTDGLPALMLAWPLFQLLRWRRAAPDRAEALLWALFTAAALSAQRFLTFWAVVAAPYLARGLAELPLRRVARWIEAPASRAGAAMLSCVLLTALDCRREDLPLGLSIRSSSVPQAACDFIAAHGIRGRAFNYFEHGGYLLWRFWPDRTRLPFMTTIPELATPAMRLDYQRAMVFADDWRRMAARYRFDYVLLKRATQPGDRYLDFLDADSSFALVFVDDVAALYIARRPPFLDTVRGFAYRRLPGGDAALEAAWGRAMRDSSERRLLGDELERAIASSPEHVVAASLRDTLGASPRAGD